MSESGNTRRSGRSRQGERRSDRRNRAEEPERSAYAFRVDVAMELLALLRDDEGEPDEDLLDEARDRLDHPLQPRDADREDLLLWMSQRERDQVVVLLEEDLADDAPRANPRVVRHVAHHLDRRLDRHLER